MPFRTVGVDPAEPPNSGSHFCGSSRTPHAAAVYLRQPDNYDLNQRIEGALSALLGGHFQVNPRLV
jgi:hypothetical protein